MQIHPGDSNDIEKVIQIDNSNSKKCKCNKIVITQDNICICGKEVDSHDQKTIKAFKSHSESPLNGVSKWKQQEALSENIIMKETRSLDLSVSGEIQFQGTSDNLAKYVKVANEFSEESMKSVMEILFGEDNWSLKKPELIISVTGGAAPLKMNHTFKETFGKGLVKVATNTNALITSGGSYNGCMRLVGEAFKKNALSVDPNKVVNLLGIANWDTIYKKSNFIKTEEHLRKQTTETFMAEYELVKPKECKEVLLDPNHTHFLLVETGASLGAEVQFRATLEETLARSLNIPITVLVVGGGFRTADSIAEAVQRKTPCVFLESSGEVANIFSFVLTRIEKTKEKNKDKKDYKIATLLQDPNFKEEIKETIRIYYKEQAKIDSIMDSIQKAVLNNEQNLNLMTVCRPVNDHADIDVAILRALLRKEKSQESATYLQTQLKLALKWNRIDIAKKFIFTEENTDKIGPLDRAMVIALTNNRVDFVKLFLENDFTLKNFVTNRILIRLYNLTPENTPINRYIRLISKRRHKRFSYRHIGAAIESLLGDSYKHRFSSSHLTKLNSYALQQLISGEDKVEDKNLINAIGSVVGGDYSLPSDIDDKSEYAEHELFMFSVLCGWPELALVFCKDGRNSIMNILMGSKIFKSFAESFENEAATYNQLAKDFETLACDILQVCYESDKDKAEITLKRTIPEFGNYTCIQGAILARDLEFISHPCFQSVLTRVWYNKINPDINKIELGIYTLFPFLSPLYFWSRSKKQYEKNIMIEKISSVDEEINQITSLEENNIHSSRVQLSARTEPTEFVKKTRFNPITNFLDFLNTPLIKFAYHQSCYILFLILFSYVLLCDFNMVYKADPITSQGLVISIPEIVLIIWVATFAVELFRKYFLNEQKTFKARIRTFLFDLWNLIDITSIVIYIVGLVLRFIPDEGCFKAARIVLSIDIIFWFFKSLYTYLFLKSVGPKIYMIWKQTVQLAYFMLIVFLFIFAFGVSTQSLLYENSPLNLTLISQVFFPAYFIMGGEYFTQTTIWAAASNECNGEGLFPYSTCPDSIGSSVTLPIYCIYLLFMNILLINLIIAIFNNTYDEIESEGKQIWKYQRYGLVYDFRYKPVIIPPFTIFYYIFIFIQFVVKTVRSVFVKSDESGAKSKMKKIVHFLSTNKATGFVYDFSENPSEEMIIMKWEKLCTNELFQKQENERAETIDSKVEDSQEKLYYLASKLEEFIENGAEDLDARIENLEKNLTKTLNALK